MHISFRQTLFDIFQMLVSGVRKVRGSVKILKITPSPAAFKAHSNNNKCQIISDVLTMLLAEGLWRGRQR